MTSKEFVAFLKGMAVAIEGTPNEEQWATIIKTLIKVKDNDDNKASRSYKSNRFTSSFDLTEQWLDLHVGEENYDKLILRDKGDYRKDCYVKYDIYNNHIKDNWNIISVFDDRNQVVDMWRNGLRLQCFQVADGNF